MESKTSKFMYYKPREVRMPLYKYKILNPLSSSKSNISITPTGYDKVDFQLTRAAINLSRSFLFLTVTIPAGAALTYNWFKNYCQVLIQKIELTNQAQNKIVDLSETDIYTKVTYPMYTRLLEHMSRDPINAMAPPRGTSASIIPNTMNANAVANRTYDTAGNIAPPGMLVGAVAPAVTTFNLQIPLSDFKRTFLEVDKDFYSNEDIQLSITFNSGQMICHRSTDVADPRAGATSFGSAAPNEVIQLSNIILYQAIESNENFSKTLRSQVELKGGMVTAIPYTQCKTYDCVGNNHTFQFDVSSSDGSHLSSILVVPVTPTRATYYTHDNNMNGYLTGAVPTDGSKITSYNSYIGPDKTTDFDITTTGSFSSVGSSLDYTIHKNLLEGTVYTSLDTYRKNWFHLEQFGGIKESPAKEPYDSLDVYGMPLASGSIKYQFNAQANGSLRYYVYTTTWRFLKIGSNGSLISNGV